MKTINIKHLFRNSALVLAVLLISACSHYNFPWVYRLDIEQGNIVDDDKLAQVKLGMTQSQVRYLLGTPMIQDTFDQSRWDYFYSFRTGKGHLERRTLTLKFDGESLSAIEKKEPQSMQLNY
jgi:outer membrane protein assembly factor BamE